MANFDKGETHRIRINKHIMQVFLLFLSIDAVITKINDQDIRHLASQTKYITSNDCRLNCINAGRKFCPSADHKSGYCCDLSDSSCPRNDVCSNDVSISNFPKYWTCPFEFICGTSFFINPNTDGTYNSIVVASSSFIIPKSCSYLITFPVTASLNDVLVIYVSTMSNS